MPPISLSIKLPTMGLVRTLLSIYLASLASLCSAVPPSGNGLDTRKLGLTCWTCPNKTDNDACNNWAPDLPCSLNNTVCKTVHVFHAIHGHSLLVNKMCAPEHECTKQHVGCRTTDKSHTKECISCCTESYCNEFIPTNQTSAIALSTIDMGLVPNTATNTLCHHFVLIAITVLTRLFDALGR